MNPDQIADSADADMRFRPPAALSALVNALLLSMLALVPQVEIGWGIVVLAVLGQATVLTLLVGMLREGRAIAPRKFVRSLLLLSSQALLYVVEALQGLSLIREPGVEAPLVLVCLLVVALYGTAIERAWEFVGAQMPGLLSSVLRVGVSAAHLASTTHHPADVLAPRHAALRPDLEV